MRLSVVITCMGRTSHLRQSLPLLLDQDLREHGYPGYFGVVIVNWSSPDDLDSYLEEMKKKHFNLMSVKITGKKYFHLAAARNAGARHAMLTYNPHLLFFTDCDILLPRDFIRRNVDHYCSFSNQNIFLHNKKLEDGSFDIWGSCIVPAEEWARYKYNEQIDTYGHEDNEFYNCLRENGCMNKPMLVEGVKAIKHDDELRMKYYRENASDMRRIRDENKKKFRYEGHFK